MTLIVPALLFGMQAYYAIQDSNADERDAEQTSTSDAERSTVTGTTIPVIGLVDDAGLIESIPEGIPPEMFVRFPDEAAARAALEADEIDQYVHIPADYVDTGDVALFEKDFRILEGGEEMGVAFSGQYQWVLSYLIDVNLTGDEKLVTMLRNPVPGQFTTFHAVAPVEASETGDQALGRVVASIVPYLFYFILLVGTGYLMRSVAAEKENRTAEVLLLSLNPRELLTGKILGLSAVTVVQLAVWTVAGLLVLDRSANILDVSSYVFPSGFFIWAALFLVLGFLMYASVMAAAGAIAPNAREANQVIWLMVVPLMPTLMFAPAFFDDPNGTIAVALSLFPLSAPSAMVTRLAITPVPLWQIGLGLLGVAFCAYVMVLLAARFFRAGNLLSSEGFSWGRFATGWRK
jgi:ABC-2 type transport system permease protein